MQLKDFLDEDLIIAELQSETKHEVIRELIEPLRATHQELDIDKAYKVLVEREQLGSTGIGEGVAIPHGKMPDLENIVLVVGRSTSGVDFAALDFRLCNIFFLVLAPEHVAGLHLRILAHVSRLLRDESFRQAFMSAKDGNALWELLEGV
ncbi:MAG: PTS sugar transporter subunit IIA [Desulfovibrionales bacterium]